MWDPAAAANKPKRSKTVTPPLATGTHGGSGEETEHYHHQSNFLPASPSTPHYHQPPLRANAQSQDLRLSLHSFRNGPPFADQTEHTLFSGQSNPLVFDSSTSSWDLSQQNHRLVTWNKVVMEEEEEGLCLLLRLQRRRFRQVIIAKVRFFSQRGSLQSINTPILRAWFDPYHHHHQSVTTNDHHPYHIPGIAFASSGEFSGFRVPARYQNEQDDKPSSASSN
ncbi:hypothetical protein Bca4012_064779 [Brassica carinata]